MGALTSLKASRNVAAVGWWSEVERPSGATAGRSGRRTATTYAEVVSHVALDELTGPPAPSPAPPPPKRSRPLGRLVLAVLLATVLCGGGALLGSAIHSDGPGFPDEWDERVEPLVSFVERTRGLRFDHPVAVYFLSPAQYRHAISSASQEPVSGEDSGAVSEAARNSRALGVQRALGLVEGDLDLDEAAADLGGEGTLAYYDFRRKVVNVRGTEVTPSMEATLVHELTHALQDQHFDLEERNDGADSEEAAVLRAVLEGDAMTVEAAYVQSLPEEQRRRMIEDGRLQFEEADAGLANVPAALRASQAIPYYLGRPYVALAETTEEGTLDPDRLDELMGELPRVTAAVFEPVVGVDEPANVVEPDLGAEPFLTDTIGAFSLFVVLADRIDPVVAMDAVDGWEGDSFVAAEVGKGDDQRVCVAATFLMRNEGDSIQLSGALSAWAETMPPEAEASVRGDGSAVELRSCDPGPEARGAGSGRSFEALLVPAGRLELASAFVGQGYGREQAACIANQVVRRLTVDELAAVEATPDLVERLSQLTTDAAAGC